MHTVFWLTQDFARVPGGDDWLSEPERRILRRFRFPKRRNDWRLGRWTAKQAVRAFLAPAGISPASLEIRAADDGAPEVFLDGAALDAALSLSHSRSRGMCVVTDRSIQVGCDLEWIEEREDNFAEDYFTSEEQSLVLAAPVGRALALSLVWSAKESALKVLRKGLSRDTRSVVINPEFGNGENSWQPWNGLCLESSQSFYGWWRACDGFVYTVASSHPASLRQAEPV